MTRAVILSGASSGIGFTTAAVLARDGFVVYGGVRSDQAAATLAAVHERIRPLRLDVTDAASIATAAETFERSGLPLAGIVNNAGIAVAGPLEYVSLGELRSQFEVNVFGPIALTQAFLPRLRADRGRIVFVGSISGRFAVPFIAPYSASKFALRALADALRMELSPLGVAVSLIEPGSVKTPIWQKGRERYERYVESLPAQALRLYGTALDAIRRQSAREERTGIPPERVAAAIAHALLAPQPHARYLIGTPARIGSLLVTLLPPRLHDRLIRKAMGIP